MTFRCHYGNSKNVIALFGGKYELETKITLAFAIQLFEEDTFDDLFIITCNKLEAPCNVALLCRKEDRHRHFRLGHLCNEEWVQHYLDFDFHRLFR